MTSFQPLRHQNQTCPVVDEQLHPVRAARAEHEDVAGERVQAQRDLHQGRQTIHAAAKIDRRRPDQHPDPRRRRDHRPSAASTRRKAAPSTSRPTRTLTPSGRAISMRISSPTGAAPPSSRSGTSAISTGRKCATVSAGAGRPCRSSRQAHQPNVLRDNPCAALLPAALATGPPRLHLNPPVRLSLRRCLPHRPLRSSLACGRRLPNPQHERLRGVEMSLTHLPPCLPLQSPLRAVLIALPGVNFAPLDAAIVIASPVCGLRPCLSPRSEIPNVPKPEMRTSSPCFSVSVTTLTRASRALPASALLSPACSATALISSVWFMVFLIRYDHQHRQTAT